MYIYIKYYIISYITLLYSIKYNMDLHVEGSEALPSSPYVSKDLFLFRIGTAVQKFLPLQGFRVPLIFCP